MLYSALLTGIEKRDVQVCFSDGYSYSIEQSNDAKLKVGSISNR